MAYTATLSLALGSSQTGLTLRASLVDSDGTIRATERDVATGFTEIGAGTYQWTYASFPAGFRGSVVFHVGAVGVGTDFTGVTVKASVAMNPQDIEALPTAAPAANGGLPTVDASNRVAGIQGTITTFDGLNNIAAADVWTYATRTLTQSAASITSAVSGGTVTFTRGESVSASITGLGSIDGHTKLWFTGKKNHNQNDGSAIVQIIEGTGLTALQGTTTGLTAGWGAITVGSSTAGNITVTLAAAASKQLALLSGGVYDVQVITSTGGVQTKGQGTFEVALDVTRATT